MPEHDLALLQDCARTAGEIASQYFKSNPQVWDKSGNAGPVTEADLAVDKMLKSELCAQRPDYGWLSEETDDDLCRLPCERVFIVDPIDGTRAFIEGSAHWAHSIAIADCGDVVAGVVYLPVNDLMFVATKDGGAFLNGAQIKVSDRSDVKGADILSSKHNFEKQFWPGGFPGINRHFRSSLAYRLCLVANGTFDGMLTLRPTWEWDVAAGALIVSEAGGKVTDQTGNAVKFNSEGAALDGMVACTPKIHAGLMAGLTRT